MAGDAARQVLGRLRQIRDKAGSVAPRAAVVAMAEAEVASVKANLSRRRHLPGEPTNAPPGEPPAMVSGSLRNSIIATPPIRAGLTWTSTVGGTTIYARIQQLGGTVEAKSGGFLVWESGGQFRRARQVTLPARPYLNPTSDKLVTTGALTTVTARAFRIGMFS